MAFETSQLPNAGPTQRTGEINSDLSEFLLVEAIPTITHEDEFVTSEESEADLDELSVDGARSMVLDALQDETVVINGNGKNDRAGTILVGSLGSPTGSPTTAGTNSAEVLPSKGRLRIRPATIADVDELVDVDIKTFGSVYDNYDVSPEEWRQGLRKKFQSRLEKLDSDLCQVIEKNGKIVGFIMCCPTSKTPDHFVSWEETTDNGTLETTYDLDGEYFYVVSLNVLPEGSGKGRNMLVANAIGKFISGGYKQAFFESRIPDFKQWVEQQCSTRSVTIESLAEPEKDKLAEEYFKLTTTRRVKSQLTRRVKNKEVPYDRLLRLYSSIGCQLSRVVPNAYQDSESMNYGVLCLYNNPVPGPLTRVEPIRHAAGNALRLASRSQALMKKLF